MEKEKKEESKITNLTEDDEPVLVNINDLFGGKVVVVPVEDEKKDKSNNIERKVEVDD